MEFVLFVIAWIIVGAAGFIYWWKIYYELPMGAKWHVWVLLAIFSLLGVLTPFVGLLFKHLIPR